LPFAPLHAKITFVRRFHLSAIERSPNISDESCPF
jgi:hypothetical protein